MPLLDNKYKIIEELGSGSFGTVFLADDEISDLQVAIKSFTNSEFSNDQIIREIRNLAFLNHPNIVRFYHHFIQDSKLHIVMEYCHGGNLLNYLRRGPLEVDESLDICIKIAEGLSFVHHEGIVHRDIKPANILFDIDGIPKLSDFGVANTAGGTMLYLPPESFITGNLTYKDKRVDIYSMGMVLLEMLLGFNPLTSIPRGDVLTAKINLNFIPSHLSHWLQEILMKSLHPSPDLRFQSSQDFKDALKSKAVPYFVNEQNFKADILFSHAQKVLSKKQWNKSRNFIERGFEISEDSVLGNLVSGKYYLKTYQLKLARKYFEHALQLNPGVDIKKELAELHLDEGNFPQAIALLQGHIQLNPLDWEAYNLLTEVYFRMNRFELAIEILNSIVKDAEQDCIWNNLVLNHINNNTLTKSILSQALDNLESTHFISFNSSVNCDKIKSWSNQESKKDKFLYQAFRFSKVGKDNTIRIEANNNTNSYNKSIFSFGRNSENDFVINDDSVSRRHCVIINFENDVWIYDLGSKFGTYVDGQRVFRKQFLLGKHKIKIGASTLFLYTTDDVLL